jgi:hypothetical protein
MEGANLAAARKELPELNTGRDRRQQRQQRQRIRWRTGKMAERDG